MATKTPAATTTARPGAPARIAPPGDKEELLVPRRRIEQLRHALHHATDASQREGASSSRPPPPPKSATPPRRVTKKARPSPPVKTGTFHTTRGHCTGPSGAGTSGTKHDYPAPITVQEVSRQCELDHKCTGFQIDDRPSDDDTVRTAWIYHGAQVHGDGKGDATCFTRDAAPKGYFSMGGRCQLGGKASGRRLSGVSVTKAARMCDADPKCVGFDTDAQDPEREVFLVTEGTAEQLKTAMTERPSGAHGTRSCLIRLDPHVPEGFRRQQGRCAVKTGLGPSKCEPNIFEAASSGTTSDAKDFADAVERCRARDDCTAVEVNKAHDTFTEYTIHTKDDVQGDTCADAYCFVREDARSINAGTTGAAASAANSHKRCDSQPFAPDHTSTPYKVVKTADAKTCQRACLSERSNCHAWKVAHASKAGEASCELYKAWNGVHRLEAPDAGSLCFVGEDTDLKGFTDASVSFAVWDKSALLETGDKGVATYAASAHACADRCRTSHACKAIGYRAGAGTASSPKDCDSPSADCGICYLFNVPFESGHMLFRHTNASDPSSDIFTANRV